MAERSSLFSMALFRDDLEDVCLERWRPGASIDLDATGGLELLVLEGSFLDGDENFTAHSWLRMPNRSTTQITTGRDGARVWVKRGHLTNKP